MRTMASIALLLLSFLISSLHPSDGQVIIASSSSFPSPPGGSSPRPTKQAAASWSSLPPKGRSDVPIRVIAKDTQATTNGVRHEPVPTSPGSRSTPTASALSSLNLRIGPTLTQPTVSRPRTDTASLIYRGFTKGDATTRRQTPPTSPSAAAADEKPPTADGSEAKEIAESDLLEMGSGGWTTGMLPKDASLAPLPTAGDEMAQYQPEARTAIAEGVPDKTDDTGTSSPGTRTVKPPVSAPTTTPGTTVTPQTETILSTAPTEKTSPAAVVTDKPTATTPPSSDGVSRKRDTASGTAAARTSQAPVAHSDNATVTDTTTTTASVPTTVDRAVKKANKMIDQSNRATKPGIKTSGSTRVSTGIFSLLPTSAAPDVRTRMAPTVQADSDGNGSVLLSHPHQAPHSTYNPTPSPSLNPFANGTFLYWGDLSRTLSFAWELHVYGSGSLFLLLFAGAALGLVLSPGTRCPHRGALALANALLFLAGGLRAALFFIDPYGTRKILPRPAVLALYNLPLHMLVWTQASLAILALRSAGVAVLPATLERPPLVAVLAVLQCSLLLASDLLSQALSPVVPVTLQVLSLCWGAALCLGFLFYIFPRMRCLPHSGVAEEVRRKAWLAGWRSAVILGRVLAVCAVLGVLCCGLHLHATLWLYGLLGDWTSFNWGWWMVHFWARLLELAWGFCLLVLGSWVFWRPQGCQETDERPAGDSRATGDLPSPGQSTGSSHRHTCWSKIVQSLRGKPCRKSDSNGIGGGGTPGEVPNNWGGQERPGADISKSLIRNQNHEQANAQPRCVKDSNRARNHRGQSADNGISDGSTGSLLRLQAIGPPPQRSVSGSLDRDGQTSLSICEFDLRPPSPIDLTRSIDEALHREHLLEGGSLFHALNQTSRSASPGSGLSPGPWRRRNSDPQLSESSEAPTESSMPFGGSILSSVPSRQVTAPPTPSHQGYRWAGNTAGTVPSSVSCPVSLRPSRTSTGHLGDDGVDDTRPFITPDSERVQGRAGRPVGSRSYLEVSRHDDSASVSSEIIDL